MAAGPGSGWPGTGPAPPGEGRGATGRGKRGATRHRSAAPRTIKDGPLKKSKKEGKRKNSVAPAHNNQKSTGKVHKNFEIPWPKTGQYRGGGGVISGIAKPVKMPRNVFLLCFSSFEFPALFKHWIALGQWTILRCKGHPKGQPSDGKKTSLRLSHPLKMTEVNSHWGEGSTPSRSAGEGGPLDCEARFAGGRWRGTSAPQRNTARIP